MAAIFAFAVDIIDCGMKETSDAVTASMLEMGLVLGEEVKWFDGDGNSRLATATSCQVRFTRASALPAWTGVSSSLND